MGVRRATRPSSEVVGDVERLIHSWLGNAPQLCADVATIRLENDGRSIASGEVEPRKSSVQSRIGENASVNAVNPPTHTITIEPTGSGHPAGHARCRAVVLVENAVGAHTRDGPFG